MASLKITVAGSQDREIETLLRSRGQTTRSVPVTEVAVLADPSASQPDVLVLDLRGHSSVPPGLSALRRAHAHTGVVIVAKSLDLELILAAMRAGANECVAEPLTEESLDAAITRVTAHQSGVSSSQSFAIIGVKGGVGATTLAVNVATVLARAATANALLIDLQVPRGDAAFHFGIESRFSVIDALDNVQKLDDKYFGSLVSRTPSGLTLLSGPGSSVGTRLEATRVRALLEFTAKHFEFTVVDVPRTEPGALEALEVMTKVVLVTTQELPAIRSAAQLVNQLGQRCGRDRVLVVMSRLDRESDIRHEDVERALGGAVAHVCPSDYRAALGALHKGRPMVLDHSDLATSWEQFAHSLAGLKVQKKPVQELSRWPRRLLDVAKWRLT